MGLNEVTGRGTGGDERISRDKVDPLGEQYGVSSKKTTFKLRIHLRPTGSNES